MYSDPQIKAAVASCIYDYSKRETSDGRVFWNREDWAKVTKAYLELPENQKNMPPTHLVQKLQMALPPSKRRKQIGNARGALTQIRVIIGRMNPAKRKAFIPAKQEVFGGTWSAPAPSPEAAPAVKPEAKLPFPADSLAGKVFSAMQEGGVSNLEQGLFDIAPMSKKDLDYVVDAVTARVTSQLARALSQQELRTKQMQLQIQADLLRSMDKLYNGILREFSSQFPPSEIGADLDAVETRIQQTEKDLRLAELPPKPKKKAVLVYGAMPTQLEAIRSKLPDLDIQASKKDGAISGDFDLVVVMTQHSTTEQQHILKRQFGDKIRYAKGAMTSVVEVVKNTMLLA